MNQMEIKKALGEKAASFIQEGMLVGLGSGSTAHCFIESLGKRCQNGLKIRAVSSSIQSENLARSFGIEVLDINSISSIDLTVDGADEVDPQKRMIKGGGGAHTREKIVASSSKNCVIIIDESKLVQKLGKFGLPVEILPFGYALTVKKIPFKGKMRTKKDGSYYVTDNGNFLFDIEAPDYFENPEKVEAELKAITGVLETGFFFNLAKTVLVGYGDGRLITR